MPAYPQQQWAQQPVQQMQSLQAQVYPPQPYQPRFVPQAAQQMQMPQQPMQSAQQPIQQQMQQMQQPQPQPQPMQQPQQNAVPIYGRYINVLKDISAGEVPMDKNYYFFPAFDMSTIYAKYWDDTGTLQTYKYVYQPDDATESQLQQQNFNTIILERLDKIEEMLANRSNTYKKKSYRNKTEQHTDQVKEQDNAIPNADA